MAPKIVCVVGPTACGKTALGVLLAKQYGGEVVSADSMQIYKGMTIGTAAPTAAEMDGVPHHMVAVSDPAEQWSAARYAREAAPVIDDILARGKLPVLVGGTGLWIDAVVKGHGFAAGCAGGSVRKELEDRLAAEGVGVELADGEINFDEEKALHERVKRHISELKLQIMKGELHKAEDVEIVMMDMLVAFKTKIMGIPSKVAPILENRDAAFIKDRLTKEVIEALNELKDYDPKAFYSDEYVEESDGEYEEESKD